MLLCAFTLYVASCSSFELVNLPLTRGGFFVSSSSGLVHRVALVAVTLALFANLSRDTFPVNLHLAFVANVRHMP